MHSTLLLVHLACAGIWLGCVLTETLFERALLGQGRPQELILVKLHQRVDLFIELPALIVVLASGALLLKSAALTPLLLAKIGFGLLAVATNLYCVWLVVRRAAVAEQGEWEAFARLDQRQHKFGALVLLSLLLALLLGGYNIAQP